MRVISCSDLSTARVRPALPTLSCSGKLVRWAEWPVALGERRLPAKIVVVLMHPRLVRLQLQIARVGSALGA